MVINLFTSFFSVFVKQISPIFTRSLFQLPFQNKSHSIQTIVCANDRRQFYWRRSNHIKS